MIRIFRIWIGSIVILLMMVGRLSGQEISEYLHQGWKLTSPDGSIINAGVPGCVHTDLLEAGLIPNPFYAAQEQMSAWVASKEWRYSLTFDVPQMVYQSARVELVFEGLDTYAEVFLNGKRILNAGNQFVEWRCDVKKILTLKENKLLVIFRPAGLVEDSLQTEYGLSLPGGKRVFTRKGQWQYGWDWAPTLPSVGIWKPVKLVGTGKTFLTDVDIKQTFTDHKLTSLEAVFTVELLESAEIGLSVIHPSLESNQRSIRLKPGLNEITFSLFFKDEIRYWWPAGYGEPFLYDLLFRIVNKKGKTLGEKRLMTGIREVELVRQPDVLGESFYFRINGIPVFAKGANWVPADHFPSRVTANLYQYLLNEASFAGMNMLRVWGGGIYEDDIFYRLCDEKGIMVWQDFMFACAMYPADEGMLDNINREALHQVSRLRKHPSVVLWCGNNEVSEGWHRWGWPSGYSDIDSARIWGDYEKIFHDLLPGIVEREGFGIPYWPSSPSLGRGDPGHVFSGDAHYWGVWHDAEPFERFREKVPRFMSEFGFQSYPTYSTLEKFIPFEAMKPDSEEMLVHQKHPRGNQLIEDYMKEWFPEPPDFEQYVYFSQMMQAEGIGIGILAHREAKPWCMGSLYWQLNDCWPAVSWSSVDYYGERKALHYKAREVFSPTIATVKVKNLKAELILINDNPGVDSVEIFFDVTDHFGSQYFTWQKESVAPTERNCRFIINLPDSLAVALQKNELVFRTKLISDSTILSDRVTLPDKPVNIPFHLADVHYSVKKPGSNFIVTLSSDVFVNGLCLTAEGVTGTFLDNYIFLMPGEEKQVEFVPRGDVKVLKIKFQF